MSGALCARRGGSRNTHSGTYACPRVRPLVKVGLSVIERLARTASHDLALRRGIWEHS